MKRGFVILFIELFCVQASLFLEALLQEYALFCQIMLLFFLALTYRRIYLLARRSLKNAQEEAKFQALQKQEQLQKEQEQLFGDAARQNIRFQKTGDSGIPAGYHQQTPDTSELPANERI